VEIAFPFLKSKMNSKNISDNLLEPEHWPAVILNSSHADVLRKVVDVSLELDELLNGDADIDAQLHSLFHGCAKIASWLPRPGRGRAPHYTRTAWDMRALSSLIPKELDVALDSSVEGDGSGLSRWSANLHDHINGNTAAHPSDLIHNAALSYDGGEYGSAWTPNLALARILLAAYLLAAIQSIEGSVLPGASFNRPAALTA
jgi:hypothetical protein